LGRAATAKELEGRIASLLASTPRAKHVEALCATGESLLGIDDAAAALAFFDRAIRTEARSARAWSGRARALVATKRGGEALGCWDRAIDADAASATPRLHKAELLVSMNLRDEAIACLSAAPTSGPDADRARALLEELQPPVRRRPQAEKHATRRAARRSDPPASGRQRARSEPPAATRGSSRPPAAGSSKPPARAERATSAKPAAREPDLAEARTLVDEGRFAEAFRKVEPIVTEFPASLAACVLRARSLAGLGKGEHAVASLERLTKGADDAEALVVLAQCLLQAKKPEPAFTAAARALDSAPSAGAYRAQGDALVALSRHTEAVFAYQRALNRAPTDATMWLALGRTLRLLRRPDEARDALARAISHAAPDDDVAAEASSLLQRIDASTSM
jgi:tetratricopeptide (TPR) repeat protein